MTPEELKKKKKQEEAKGMFDLLNKLNPFAPSVEKKDVNDEIGGAEQLVDRQGNPIKRKKKPE